MPDRCPDGNDARPALPSARVRVWPRLTALSDVIPPFRSILSCNKTKYCRPASYLQWNQYVASYRLCGNRKPSGLVARVETADCRGLYPIPYCAFRLDPEKQGIVLKLLITNAIYRGSLILEMAGAGRPQPGRGCRRPLGLVERASGATFGRISRTRLISGTPAGLPVNIYGTSG